MGRPPLEVGTYGSIRFYKLSNGQVRAVANYRDYDGVTRPVERTGRGKADAERRLKAAFRDRTRRVAGEEITARTKVRVAADRWLVEINESGKASRTKSTYRESWHRDLDKAVGALEVCEMTVPMVDRVLRAIRDNTGHGSAVHAKVVLSGLLGLAVRHGALHANPVREVTLGARKVSASDEQFELAAADLSELREVIGSSKKAVRSGLLDLVDVLSVLGCRIGELLALDWSRVDFAAGTVRIEGTVIREPGVGLFVQSHTKTRAGMRTLTLPTWAVSLLRRRWDSRISEWVFPSSAGTLRDPENARKQLRTAVSRSRFEGLHPHVFRHLVATMLDEAGLSAREIADYLGHERVSMTQDVYMNRRAAGTKAAAALGKLNPEAPQKRG